MYARMSVYELPRDRSLEATESFREAIDGIKEVGGLKAAYFLLTCEDESQEKAIALTLWEDRAAMETSRIRAARLRADAARAVEGEVVSVEEFEVAIHEEGSD